MGERLKLRARDVEWREIEGEIVAVDMATANYLAVNRTGAVLWPTLARGTDRDELVDELVSRFEIDRGDATADVDAFILMLTEQQLLEP